MVPTDKHQWDGGVCPTQGCLQVALLIPSELAAWRGNRAGSLFAGFAWHVPTTKQRRELFLQLHHLSKKKVVEVEHLGSFISFVSKFVSIRFICLRVFHYFPCSTWNGFKFLFGTEPKGKTEDDGPPVFPLFISNSNINEHNFEADRNPAWIEIE